MGSPQTALSLLTLLSTFSLYLSLPLHPQPIKQTPMLNKLKILLQLSLSSDPLSVSSSPSPSPSLAPTPSPLRPFLGFPTSPLPRPSILPPLQQDLRHGSSPKLRILVVVLSVACAIAAASTILLFKLRKREKQAPPKRENLCNSMDKVSFDPSTQSFYLEEREDAAPQTLAQEKKSVDIQILVQEDDDVSESFHSFSPPRESPAAVVPPPPPPPPPPPGKKGAPPPPPPPPFAGGAKKNASPPLTKLKPLHWDKVRAASDKSMVWDKIRSSSFELDEETIGSLFSYNLQSSGKNEEVAGKSNFSPGKRILESKRLQNLTILLKAVNATSDQVCCALTQGTGLKVQQMEALEKMVPTEDEQEKLLSFEGDANSDLDPAEKFLREILSVPFSFSRIQSMLYRESFADETDLLRDCYATLEDACKEMRSSKLFMRLLEAVLKTGNRMNVGTIRGGAKAFKLNALLKLADVKGTDGRTTLLHFVVQEMVRVEGSTQRDDDCTKFRALELVSDLGSELYSVKKTASMDFTVLSNTALNLSSGLHQLQELLRRCMDESFMETMKPFSEHAVRVLEELKEEEGRVLGLARDITEYFHGDVDKEEKNPLGIFVIVRDFLESLDRICKELRVSGPTPFSPSRASPLSCK